MLRWWDGLVTEHPFSQKSMEIKRKKKKIDLSKNLQIKHSTGSSDPYCIVKIDNEVIIRTATVWKTLFPFWGEEYEVHLSPNFHCVSFYVMDEDALSRDDVIGKVCLSQSLLMESPKGYSGWLSLTEIDLDEEVQGELHLQIEITGSGAARKLRCTVFDARDLARKDRNGASDPFVRVRYNGKTHETSVSPGFGKTSGWGGHLGRGDCYRERRVSDPQPGFTAVFRIGFREAGIALAGFSLQVIKKSCYPRWNETFEFELDESATEKLCVVEVWDWDLVSRNDFLGKVVFNVQGLETVQREEGWFLLRPEKSKPRVDEGSLGSLHLQVQLRDEMVLPSIHYQPLVQLLCQEVRAGVKDKRVHLMTLIDETTAAECRQEVAVNLVKLFLGHGLATEFLDLLFELELDKTDEPNTLFRSNSLASKSMESFLKVAGMQYLHQVLGPTLRRVFEEKRYVELDPSKVESREVGCSSLHRIQSESDVIQQSAQLLQSYLADLLAAIAGSVKACPVVIRATFQRLFKRVGERFPEEKDQSLKFIAVTSFLCLRFFSPAIMSPKLFHLREKHADARASRALLLLAKVGVGTAAPSGRRVSVWFQHRWRQPRVGAPREELPFGLLASVWISQCVSRILMETRHQLPWGQGGPFRTLPAEDTAIPSSPAQRTTLHQPLHLPSLLDLSGCGLKETPPSQPSQPLQAQWRRLRRAAAETTSFCGSSGRDS
ncbi:Ras GTPase-activating protein 4 [Varanus komodoensis]|nr:Ras GTPase-activating protein 4 [Varanus komodoensis]